MTIVVYNPNCIDSIFSAAILQVLGSKTFSNRECFPSEPDTYIWLSTLPVKTFLIGKPHPESKHWCFLRGCQMNKRVRHALIPNALYGEEQILEAGHDVDRSLFENGFSKKTLLEQVCNVMNIHMPDIFTLTGMINSFSQKHVPVETLAGITNNVMLALSSLLTGESFQMAPIAPPTDNRNMESMRQYYNAVLEGQHAVDRLNKEAIRFFNHGVKYFEHREKGIDRIIQSFGRDDFWFFRRRLLDRDIGFNFTYTPAGMMVDSTKEFTYDFKFNQGSEAYIVQI